MPKRTALFEEHQKLGGRLIDFGGWELPVQYSGTLDEHIACREKAGLFDVSHMGEVHVEGREAEAFLNHLVTNNVSRISVGQAQYTVMCNPTGGIVDDLLIYRRATDRFLVVINAGNIEKDYTWMRRAFTDYKARHPAAQISMSNESSNYTQIALQGRLAQEILQPLTETPLSDIKYYWFKEGRVLGSIPAIVARTGYTGEDGFELYVPWGEGPRVWRALLEAGAPKGLKPCGLGARDTLRLEMRFPLYGNELNDETTPLEAGLGWITKLDKSDFIGRDALAKQKESGVPRALIGLTLLDRGIPRGGYKIFTGDGTEEVGTLTSGTQSPSLKKSIALGYVRPEFSAVGTRLSIEIRGVKIAAEVIPTPFYKRPY